jgi:hypothetical protein
VDLFADVAPRSLADELIANVAPKRGPGRWLKVVVVFDRTVAGVSALHSPGEGTVPVPSAVPAAELTPALSA